MNLKISFQIAKTHLLAKKKQTLVAMLGVTFGIAMFSVMISFMRGVNQFLEDSALESSPHLRIYKEVTSNRPSLIDKTNAGGFNVVHHQKPQIEQMSLKNPWQMAQTIEKIPNVVGTSPQISSQVFYNTGSAPITGTIAGIDVMRENKLYNIVKRTKSGDFMSLLANQNGVVMGFGLANKLNLKVGDNVNVTTPTGNVVLLKIVGIFGFGIGTIDNTKSYANIAKVQEILGRDKSYITDLHVKMKDPLQALEIKNSIKNQYGYKVEDWAEANAFIMAGEKIRNSMTFVVCITLLVVAGFGIYNIMNMNVINKMKDIAILKATGFGSKDIVSIFLLQAIIIGFLGALLGISLGLAICYILSITPFPAGDFISIKTFPVLFDPRFYALGVVFGIVTTLIAGYAPSKKASKIDPVAILRG
jgi:lipoprotein-releasing system permease protein